ncbi:phosphatidylglycerophosphatase A [bacterium]|nr:phosphatidylglycerophosphatase A [bacterium]
MKLILQFIVSFFGIGFIPFASGTFVTLTAIPIFFLLSILKVKLITAIIVFTILPMPFYYLCISKFEDGNIPKYLTLDKIAGFLTTMAFVESPYPLTAVIIGFFLFRIFDIAKPLPIPKLHELKYGLGIPISTVIAGIYANIILQNICAFELLSRFPKAVLF